MSIISTVLSTLLPTKSKTQTAKQAIYVDARTFDPCQARRPGQAVILRACNEGDTIFDRVCQVLQTAAGVVVIDQSSTDGTPYFAAEAGAVVVLERPGAPRQESMREARRLARKISPSVVEG